jgi:hypothetical protein
MYSGSLLSLRYVYLFHKYCLLRNWEDMYLLDTEATLARTLSASSWTNLNLIIFTLKDEKLASNINVFLLEWADGVQLGPLGTAASNRPIVPTPGDYDDGEIGGMMVGRGNRSTRRKPAPVPLCLPQIPHAARTRTRAAAVGSQRLTAWAMARPKYKCSLTRFTIVHVVHFLRISNEVTDSLQRGNIAMTCETCMIINTSCDQ